MFITTLQGFTRTILVAGIAGLVLGSLGAAPARADDGWHRGREHREHEWREHEWREHEWRHRPPVVVAPGYYAAPGTVYVAPPVVYAPPPPVVYAPPPGINVVIPLRIR
jgi:hypothetical protein